MDLSVDVFKTAKVCLTYKYNLGRKHWLWRRKAACFLYLISANGAELLSVVLFIETTEP